MLVGFGDLVFAQALHHVLAVRHRRDAFGIDALHLLDQFENAVQMALSRGGLGIGDFDAGEPGDPFDLGHGQGHGIWA